MEDTDTNISDNYLEIVGFKINYESEMLDFYCIMATNFQGPDYFVSYDKHPICFTNIDFAEEAFQLASPADVLGLKPPSKSIALQVDLPQALLLLKTQDTDVSDTIINVLNTFFDLVNATEHLLPTHYKKHLFAFADHLTFDKNYAHFFSENDVQRSEIADGILWMIGAITSSMKILRFS